MLDNVELLISVWPELHFRIGTRVAGRRGLRMHVVFPEEKLWWNNGGIVIFMCRKSQRKWLWMRSKRF